MSLVNSFPSWPIAVVDALAAKRTETPHGCGSCIHAAWMNPVDTAPGLKAPIEFSLGACRAGVQLERSKSGLRATQFCTSWNVVLGPSRALGARIDSESDGAGMRAAPAHPGLVDSRSPSLRPLFR